MASNSGLPTRLETVAELGPGDSLGIGLAALLSGANRYYAMDVIRHSNTGRNLAILDELVELFNGREEIPDNTEFPKAKPILESYEFPHNVLTEDILTRSLHPQRIESIRGAILASESNGTQNSRIIYSVPWHDANEVRGGIVDMVYSQACMEHVDDLQFTYQTLYQWLKPGGYMSHEIDFSSHGRAQEWNGHWGYSDLEWRLIRGARPYLLNRKPLTAHIYQIQQAGFKLVLEKRDRKALGIGRKDLAPRFADISDQDISTSSAFLQAIKRPV